MNPVTVVFGANGCPGRYLSRHLTAQGKEVVCIARSREGWSGDGMFLEWDGKTAGPWALALEGAEAVINLSGRSMAGGCDETGRLEVLNSRVWTTKIIGDAIAACKVAPKVWLNASTAAWYRHAEERSQDEWTGENGDGVDGEMARAWEEAFFSCQIPAWTRKVAMRIGLVLANEPGTVFESLSKCGSDFLEGGMACGMGRVSWIHIEDLLRAVEKLVADPFISGVVNLVSPECPVRADLMAAFRKGLGTSIGFSEGACWSDPVPGVVQVEAELTALSQWVRPTRLLDAGFRWKYPAIDQTVADLKPRGGLEKFFRAAESRVLGGGHRVAAC